jgi:hypothetical protein
MVDRALLPSKTCSRSRRDDDPDAQSVFKSTGHVVQPDQGNDVATTIARVGSYDGHNASGGPVGVGEAKAKSLVLNLGLVTLIGRLGNQISWGFNPHARIGGG